MNREEMINEVREKLSEAPPSPWEAVVYPGSKPWNTPERGEWSVVCPHPDIPDRPEYRLNLATIGFGPKAKAIAELIVALRNAAPALLDEITSLKLSRQRRDRGDGMSVRDIGLPEDITADQVRAALAALGLDQANVTEVTFSDHNVRVKAYAGWVQFEHTYYVGNLRNAAPALLDEITSLKPHDEPVPDHQRYPHARCHDPNPHTTHTWGDPLHYCDGAPTSEETTPAAHIVYTPDQHRCHDEIEALDPTPVGTIAKCSCGTHYTKCCDQRDGPYWVTGWDPSR